MRRDFSLSIVAAFIRRHWRTIAGAGLAGGTGQGGEVDVGGQVGAARLGQDRMGGMTAQGLKSGADAGRPMAVVDDQRGAAMGG